MTRIHELSQYEILTIRNTLNGVLEERFRGEGYRRVFFLVKDEDEAENDDDIIFQVEGNHLLKMLAIR